MYATPAATQSDSFLAIPATELPCGLAVPAFRVGQFLCSAGAPNDAGAACRRLGDRVSRQAAVTEDGYPWVHINFADAKQAMAAAGFAPLRESQALAIAWLIYQQHENWTGGEVGHGALFQGLHADSVDCPMPANYMPPSEAERRWHALPDGQRIYDFAGNAYSWIFDDVQGDENGLIARRFAADSLSLQAPYPRLEKGLGWRPDGTPDGSGRALIRGGYWDSGRDAGAFGLGGDWPGDAYDYVGFRCTRPGL